MRACSRRWATKNRSAGSSNKRVSITSRALEIDPLSNEAALNLGVIEAQSGNAIAP